MTVGMLTGAERLHREETRDAAIGRALKSADDLMTSRINRRDGEIQAVDAMANFGGSFVRALAHAARCADQSNYERLRNTFPELWTKYQREHERRREHKYE